MKQVGQEKELGQGRVEVKMFPVPVPGLSPEGVRVEACKRN